MALAMDCQWCSIFNFIVDRSEENPLWTDRDMKDGSIYAKNHIHESVRSLCDCNVALSIDLGSHAMVHHEGM